MTPTNAGKPTDAVGNSAREPCGAVLVCGAGIAGIQASLDLSAAGFRACLVEQSPAIGGGVARLDETLPAGDRTTCLIMPKVVECTRDRNVDVFTMSEVIALKGQPGRFIATIRRRPCFTDDDTRAACVEQEEDVFDLEVGAVLVTPTYRKGGWESFASAKGGSQLGDLKAEKSPTPFFFVQESEDIADTVTQGSAAAGRAMALLAAGRGSLARKKVYPPQRDVTDEPPRVGLFVCHCGDNIASVVDVEALVEQVRQLPHVAFVETDAFLCSGHSQDRIQEAVAAHRLSRVVIASCTPETHEPIFRDTLRYAGLNPYLLEMANIRDQCSWVHSGHPKQATEKATDLVRMAVGRAVHLVPLVEETVPVKGAALVIGGGIAGMTAALGLADQGFPVHLVEKTDRLEGTIGQVHAAPDDNDLQAMRAETVRRVQEHPQIDVYLNAVVSKVDGRVGDFTSTISPCSAEVEHGVVVLAASTVPRADREGLAELLRVPLSPDGSFLEAHPELRPVDFAREGMFLCGTARVAESMDQTVAQANAVAARATSILSRDEIPVDAATAWVDPDKCISCMTCVHICPYMAPRVGEENKAEIQGAICRGCGSCSAECPAKAITLRHYIDAQILGAIDSLLASASDKKEIELAFPEQVGVAPPRWHMG